MIKWIGDPNYQELDLGPLAAQVWQLIGIPVRYRWEVPTFRPLGPIQGNEPTMELAKKKAEEAAEAVAAEIRSSLQQLSEIRNLELEWMTPGTLAEFKKVANGAWLKCQIMEEPVYHGSHWTVKVGKFSYRGCKDPDKAIDVSTWDIRPRGTK